MPRDHEITRKLVLICTKSHHKRIMCQTSVRYMGCSTTAVISGKLQCATWAVVRQRLFPADYSACRTTVRESNGWGGRQGILNLLQFINNLIKNTFCYYNCSYFNFLNVFEITRGGCLISVPSILFVTTNQAASIPMIPL